MGWYHCDTASSPLRSRLSNLAGRGLALPLFYSRPCAADADIRDGKISGQNPGIAAIVVSCEALGQSTSMVVEVRNPHTLALVSQDDTALADHPDHQVVVPVGARFHLSFQLFDRLGREFNVRSSCIVIDDPSLTDGRQLF